MKQPFMNHHEGAGWKKGESVTDDNGQIKWLSSEKSDEYRQTDPRYTNIHTHTELVIHICSDLQIQSLPTEWKTMELST